MQPIGQINYFNTNTTSNPSFQITNKSSQNVGFNVNNFQQPPASILTSSPILNQSKTTIQKKYILAPNLLPVKPSNINNTRPLRNIFPLSTYVTSTKIDENLIIIPDDEQ
jgi:hypothetical protein